ncbi:helix-turn-helix domain-containing protein [Candidatus Pacearchaeota archaeon]|nr:helix-turn-helix domain-containing protein [Candidatus Pacearchaeota archaeon]
MKTIMPQEIEVWYLVPALRREIAKNLITKHNLSQRQAAKILGITESAISQYLSSKRATEINFSKQELGEIEKTTQEIIKNPKNTTEFLYRLSVKFRGSDFICKLHRKHDPSFSKDCRLCKEPISKSL